MSNSDDTSRLRLPGLLALAREDSSFADGFRISVWLGGCVCLLLAFAGSSPTLRGGTLDPLAASLFPTLRPAMAAAASGTQVSAGAFRADGARPLRARRARRLRSSRSPAVDAVLLGRRRHL